MADPLEVGKLGNQRERIRSDSEHKLRYRIWQLRHEIRQLSADLVKPGTPRAKEIIRKHIRRCAERLAKLDARIETLQCKQAERERVRRLKRN